jgi:FkbM family methyltransferase
MSTQLFDVITELSLPPPQGILQVGASYGQELLLFRERGIRRGVFIEPLDEPFRTLAHNCRMIPDFVAIQTLCADRTGDIYPFHVSSNHGMSSSILKPVNHLIEYDYVTFDKTIDVTSNRLDDVIIFIAEHGHEHVANHLDTLYMDTQGAELKVLLGAGKVLDNIRYIWTEVTRNELYQGAPRLDSLMAFLDCSGFTLNNVNFGSTGVADALFIRKSLLGYPA